MRTVTLFLLCVFLTALLLPAGPAAAQGGRWRTRQADDHLRFDRVCTDGVAISYGYAGGGIELDYLVAIIGAVTLDPQRTYDGKYRRAAHFAELVARPRPVLVPRLPAPELVTNGAINYKVEALALRFASPQRVGTPVSIVVASPVTAASPAPPEYLLMPPPPPIGGPPIASAVDTVRYDPTFNDVDQLVTGCTLFPAAPSEQDVRPEGNPEPGMAPDLAPAADLQATFTVNEPLDAVDEVAGDGRCTTAIPGRCSLRAAVQEANASPGPDTIVLPNGVLRLIRGSQTGASATAALDDLNVEGDLTIAGQGAANTVIDVNGIAGAFTLAAGARLTLSGVTIRGGFPGVETAFIGSVFVRGFRPGGAISVPANATLTIRDSAIVDSISGDAGGAIFNAGRATLTNVRIEGNQSGGAGGAIFNTGRLTISGGVLRANRALLGGGAIVNRGELILRDVTLSGNAADDGALAGGDGGALLLQAGSAVLQNSLVANNSARASGGGAKVEQGARLEVTASTFAGNSAAAAGASGGAIDNRGALQIVNSTLAGNNVWAAAGGAVFSTGSAELRGVTVAGNSGGAALLGGPFRLGQSIVAAAGNTCSGTIQSLGYNLETGSACGLDAAGDRSRVDPLLAPLGDYGGPTPTLALLQGSPAVDGGPDPGPCTLADQRGRARVGVCDIGAFEAAQYSLSVSPAAPTATAPAGAIFSQSIAVANSGPATVPGVGLQLVLPSGIELKDARAGRGSCDPATLVCVLGDLEPGASVALEISLVGARAGSFSVVGRSVTAAGPGLVDPVRGDDSFVLRAEISPAEAPQRKRVFLPLARS